MTNSPHEMLGCAATTGNAVTVDVWHLPLDLARTEMEELTQTLSSVERERAARFRFERDRRRFIAARGLVRAILGRYLSMTAAAIALDYNPFGKPFLAQRPLDLCFNVAHSGDIALLAIAPAVDVGVDIEMWRKIPNRDLLAARFFAASEVAAIAQLPEQVRDVAFLTCWARKEAYVKAVGMGLSEPLDSFEVSMVPDLPAAVLRISGSAEAARVWSLHDLSQPPIYSAAVAVHAPRSRIVVQDSPVR